MPSRDAWFCVSMLSKWCARCGSEWGSPPWPPANAAGALDDDMLDLLAGLVIGVRLLGVLERVLEVFLDRRRAGQPLVALRVPGVRARHLAVLQGVDQVDEDDDEPE